MTDRSAEEMRLGLQSLRAAVGRKFAAARQSGDLVFSDTEVAILKTQLGVPFQLRFCPALSKKPTDNKSPAPADDKKPAKRKFDPFANPSSELLVANVPPTDHTHTLVLNKFPVIPNHFILATRDDKPQTNLLEPDDLAVAYACLRAWREDQSDTDAASTPSDLFAFFNSGPHSGASQPHRHLQFLPVSDMQLGLSEIDDSAWQPLIHSLTTPTRISQPYQLDHNPHAPFLALSTPLSPSTTTTTTTTGLHDRYTTLLRAAQLLTHTPITSVLTTALTTTPITSPPISSHVPLSYNLALTTSRMAIIPRRAEVASIPGLPTGGEVALNGTVLGGTLMVKERAEWDALRTRPGALDEVLRAVGYPVLTEAEQEQEQERGGRQAVML